MKNYMNNKSKILFIMHMPPPVHGAAMMGKHIHDSQVINQAFDCRYFNLTLAKNLQDIGKGGIRKFKDFIRQLWNIRKEVKAFQPDLCYVTPNAKGGAFYKDFVVVMMLKAMRQKVVIHYHNKGIATRQHKFLDNFLYRNFFKNLKVILLAEPLYQDISKYVKRENVSICPNGIPTNEIIPLKTSHPNFNILFLSNMMKEKGVWDLVEACRLLKKEGKKFHCDFVGKWSDITETDFYSRIQEDGLEQYITAHGAKYGDEKNAFFQKTDLFVFPTYYNNECFPLVLLEAMEQGIACISTNEGGISAIIQEGKTGYIVKKQEPQILAGKIEYLIDHPDICQRMGQTGKDRFDHEFTLDKFENQISKILKTIIFQDK